MDQFNREYIMAEWQHSFKNIVAMLVRDQQELEQYKTKPDANLKAVAIREQKNQELNMFVQQTKAVIEAQAAACREANIKASQCNYYKNRCIKAEGYMASKMNTYDLSLLDYMHASDFK
jgi:hypothetical protein